MIFSFLLPRRMSQIIVFPNRSPVRLMQERIFCALMVTSTSVSVVVLILRKIAVILGAGQKAVLNGAEVHAVLPRLGAVYP